MNERLQHASQPPSRSAAKNNNQQFTRDESPAASGFRSAVTRSDSLRHSIIALLCIWHLPNVELSPPHDRWHRGLSELKPDRLSYDRVGGAFSRRNMYWRERLNESAGSQWRIWLNTSHCPLPPHTGRWPNSAPAILKIPCSGLIEPQRVAQGGKKCSLVKLIQFGTGNGDHISDP